MKSSTEPVGNSVRSSLVQDAISAEAHRALLASLGISMLPQPLWDPQPLSRLQKLAQHYKKTLNKETILAFLQPKNDAD